MLLSVYTGIIGWIEQHQLPCLFRSMFHTDCPGCGLQRSTIALLRGQVYESARLYPALIPMLLFFLFLLLNQKMQLKNTRIYVRGGIMTICCIIAVSYIYKLFN